MEKEDNGVKGTRLIQSAGIGLESVGSSERDVMYRGRIHPMGFLRLARSTPNYLILLAT